MKGLGSQNEKVGKSLYRDMIKKTDETVKFERAARLKTV